MTIQELLQEHRVEFLEFGHHHNREGWLQIHVCPFCGSDRYHLGYNIGSNYASCWRCGHHSAWSLFRKLGLPVDATKHLHRSQPTARTEHHGTLKEPAGRGPLLSRHKDYLRSRGLDPGEATTLWRAEGIGIAARLSWRIYIPVIARGKTVSWTTRAIGERVEQRYISASPSEEQVPHKRTLYGLDYVRDTAIVTEGPLDVWNVGPGAVATFGLVLTPAQLKALANIPRRFICFDNEPKAQQRARELAGQLSCQPGSTWICCVDAEDPGSASRREVRHLRRATGLDNV